MAVRVASTILAVAVTVSVLGHVLIAVVLPALEASSQLHDLHMLYWRVVAVVAAKTTAARMGSVLGARA